MIKPIDEIPVTSKRKTQREEIRKDIMDAIAQGINKFEFVGDYNFKYLNQYAQEEAHRYITMMVIEKVKECKKKYLQPNETSENGFYTYIDIYGLRKSHKYIAISSIKAEPHRRVFCPHKYIAISSIKAEPHRRVFCQIDLSTLDEDVDAIVKAEIEQTRQDYIWTGEKFVRKDRVKNEN